MSLSEFLRLRMEQSIYSPVVSASFFPSSYIISKPVPCSGYSISIPWSWNSFDIRLPLHALLTFYLLQNLTKLSVIFSFVCWTVLYNSLVSRQIYWMVCYLGWFKRQSFLSIIKYTIWYWHTLTACNLDSNSAFSCSCLLVWTQWYYI